jgi:hypothetical protein
LEPQIHLLPQLFVVCPFILFILNLGDLLLQYLLAPLDSNELSLVDEFVSLEECNLVNNLLDCLLFVIDEWILDGV